MFTLLCYEPDQGPATTRDNLDDALAAWGAELDGGVGDTYRPGRWRDAGSGALIHVDLGDDPLEQDEMHPPRRYTGWKCVPLALHLPLAGPHWLAVEALRGIEQLLARLPDVCVLDCEDTCQEPGGEPGPFPWDRPRLIASWRTQMAAQVAGRKGLPRMDVEASLHLWRYRRERAEGARQHPGVFWPEALVLLDRATGEALPAAIWPGIETPYALPPVSVVVVTDGRRGGSIPSARLLEAAVDPQASGQGLATILLPGPALDRLRAAGPVLPANRFAALGDLDWTD